MKSKGLSIDELAAKTGLRSRTLQRKLRGEPAFAKTIALIAAALDVKPYEIAPSLRPVAETTSNASTETFHYTLTVRGSTHNEDQRDHAVTLTPRVIRNLRQAGITVESYDTQTAAAKPCLLRIISTIWVRTKDEPAWVMAAVRKDLYGDFTIAIENASIDLQRLDRYGEVIVSGHGAKPPEHIVRRVAELFQADPDRMVSRIRHAYRDDLTDAERATDAYRLLPAQNRAKQARISTTEEHNE